MTKQSFYRHSRLDRESFFSNDSRIKYYILFQVQPLRIYCINQLILPLSFEMLYLLFTDNGLFNVRK